MSVKKASAQSPQLTALIGSIHVTEKYFLAQFTFLTQDANINPNWTRWGMCCDTSPVKTSLDHEKNARITINAALLFLGALPVFLQSTFETDRKGRIELEGCVFWILSAWLNLLHFLLYSYGQKLQMLSTGQQAAGCLFLSRTCEQWAGI